MLTLRVAATEESVPVSTEALVLPTIGTLLVTGAVASLVCRSPDQPFANWRQLLVRAVGYVLLAGVVHVAAVWLVDRVYGRAYGGPSRGTTGRVMRGTWLCAGLLPVTVLLAHAGSAWAALVLPVIAVVAVLFVRRASPEAGRLARRGAPAGIAAGLFEYEAPPPLVRTLGVMVVVAVLLELGAVMLASWQYALAGLLFGLCVMVVLWRVPLRVAALPGTREGRRATRLGQVEVSTAMAVLLTILALLPSLGGSLLAGRIAGLLGTRAMAARAASAPPLHAGKAFSGALSGVILTLPAKPREKLLPPPPERVSPRAEGSRRVQRIPFDGAYWYFRAPELRPRADARRVRGDPTKVDIHSTDMVALAMEAHQRLEAPLATNCCGAIRVAVRNAEVRVGAIGLELVLSEDSLKEEGWRRSLGTVMLQTSLAPHESERDEVVEFAVPKDLPDGVFDEMTLVVSVPAGERSRRGARVGIESFEVVGR